MSNEIIKIANFMGEAFLHIWPYLLVTIPLAVAVNMSGASKYIKRAFDAGPIAAIVLATVVGAFSPFCSCGVIPVIAALLISGGCLQPLLFLRGNSGYRSAVDQWCAFGTGHVLLDCITLHGSGNIFLKCRNHRVEFGSMAPGWHTLLKPDRRVHHAFGNAKAMDRYECPAQPERLRNPKYLFTISKCLAETQKKSKGFFLLLAG